MSAADGRSGGTDQHPLLNRLSEALAERHSVRIERTLQLICSRPALLSRRFGEIEQLMLVHGKQAVLAAVIRKAIASGQVPQKIQNKIAEAGGPELGYGKTFFSAEDDNARPAGDISQHAGPIVDRAWQHTDEININTKLVEKLFACRQQTSMPRSDWEHRFRFAAALESLTDDYAFSDAEMAPLFHPDTGKRLQEVADRQAALYVIGHVGFTAARNYFIRKFLKNSIPFRPSLNRPPYVWEKNDGRTALFCGLRALSSGTSIVLAPDGSMGTLRSPVEVLGSEASISTGAIFLAHETKLAVIWLNVEFRNGCFVPILMKAPQALPKEKLKDYQLRFVNFYQDMLNQYFTGDPDNLVIRNRWKATFLGHAQRRDKEE